MGGVDPSIYTFGTAVVSLATAITGLTTAILNRRNSQKNDWVLTRSLSDKNNGPSKKTQLLNFVK